MNIDGQEYISHYGLWPIESRAPVNSPPGDAQSKDGEAREPYPTMSMFLNRHDCEEAVLAYQKLDFGKLD